MSKSRPKGSGSIYVRSDGRVVGEYEAGGKKRYIYGRTKKEVSRKLMKAIADRDSGFVYDAGSMTVGEYLDKWLGAIRHTLRHGTFPRYEEATRIHIKPTLGKVRLCRLDALQLQALYEQKRDGGLSPRTVQIVHATAHKALKQAVKWSLVPRNVAAAVDPPRAPKAEIKPLTIEQAKQLLAVAKKTQPKLYALYTLAITTGLTL